MSAIVISKSPLDCVSLKLMMRVKWMYDAPRAKPKWVGGVGVGGGGGAWYCCQVASLLQRNLFTAVALILEEFPPPVLSSHNLSFLTRCTDKSQLNLNEIGTLFTAITLIIRRVPPHHAQTPCTHTMHPHHAPTPCTHTMHPHSTHSFASWQML